VNGSYAPLSTINIADDDAPRPRFYDDSQAMDLFTINSCSTSLLWPYVTNIAGFETGMVISNTSLDPFGTATQEGACTINYYGTGGNTVATTPVVPAGHYAIWSLSSGGEIRPGPMGTVPANPGFEGYVIATCEFQYAHGYAFLSDLGATVLAQGYLALVIDDDIGAARSGKISEVLGN
jgi:hypothetical protein